MTLCHETHGAGPDLVLLHGWGMNLGVWSSLLAAWRHRYRMTLIDLPGHGASPNSGSADAALWAAECLAVAPPRAYWIGWSLGGQVTLEAALQAPARVAGVTLVAATPRFVRDAGWDCAMPAETFHAFADALEADADAALKRFLSLQVRGDERARATLKTLRRDLRQRPVPSRDGLRQGLEVLLRTDLRGRLPHIERPMHWVLGDRDTLVPRTLREWLADRLPSCRVDIIAGAGHAPWLSHPEGCLPRLSEVIDGQG